MSEKQVVLSKSEYDEMEKEINQLRSIVKERTITKIIQPNYHSIGVCGLQQIGFRIEYVSGFEESEVLKEIKQEIEKIRNENSEYESRVFELSVKNSRLDEENKNWKKMSWYKKIFS